MDANNRRELRTRARAWPSALARLLARAGVRPNQVSIASVVFAMLAAYAFHESGRPGRNAPLLLVLAAIGIQLRLLCNMLDGLLAVEGGLKSRNGELFNEIPDRIADILILLDAGVAVSHIRLGVTLGWTSALLAVLTAYVRLLGGSLGQKQDFGGPMAKQHRMFLLTVGALGAAIESSLRGTTWSLYGALVIIVLGSLLTLVLRTRRIARRLQST